MKRLPWPALILLIVLMVRPAAGQDCDLSGWRVFVDPGHGGSDPGAIGPSGLQEKDVTLDVGLKLRGWLWSFGAEVDISRTDDVFVPLSTRADLANAFGAHRFASIHMNAFSDPSANGTETFVVPNPSVVTRDFGQKIQDSLLWYLGLRDRGLKFANFTVLVRTFMPAALSESAFITNPTEEWYLSEESVRWSVAEAHAYAICASLSEFGDWPTVESPPTFADAADVVLRQSSRHIGQLEVVRTIEGPVGVMAPRFSPDGSQIAFSGRGYNGLYVADLTTDRTARVTQEPGAGFAFGWSPDGHAIAYSTQQRSTFVVRAADLVTHAIETVAEASHPLRPQFAENGTLLVADEDGRKSVSRWSSGASTGDAASSHVSVFVKNHQLWLQRGTASEQLTDDGDLVYTDSKLSPTNDRVLVVGSGAAGSGLFVMDLRTRQRHVLALPVEEGARGLNRGYDATWSPDGRHVLLSVTHDDGHAYVASDLYVVNAEGTASVRLTEDRSVKLHVEWSARNEIAFEEGDGRIVIAKLRASGSSPHRE